MSKKMSGEGSFSPIFFYNQWNEIPLRSEAATYRHTDAWAWMGMAASICSASKSGNRIARYDVLGRESIELFEPNETDTPAVRLIRYLATENFFLLLLAGQGEFPYARVAMKLKFDSLKAAIESISVGMIPWEVYSRQHLEMSFETWLSIKLGAGSQKDVCATLVNFVKTQARFISDRTFFNALKHGRVMSGLHDVSFDGIPHLPNTRTRFIAVDNWDERKVGEKLEVSHTRAFESFDAEGDLGVLYILGVCCENIIRVRAEVIEMKLSRLSTITTRQELPVDISLNLDFLRFKGLPVHIE